MRSVSHHGGVGGLVSSTHQRGSLSGRTLEHGVLGEQLAGGSSDEGLDRRAGADGRLAAGCLRRPAELH